MANIYLAKYRMLETISIYLKFGDRYQVFVFPYIDTKLILYKCDFPMVTRKNPSNV